MSTHFFLENYRLFQFLGENQTPNTDFSKKSPPFLTKILMQIVYSTKKAKVSRAPPCHLNPVLNKTINNVIDCRYAMNIAKLEKESAFMHALPCLVSCHLLQFY